jgi:hypothetical protein
VLYQGPIRIDLQLNQLNRPCCVGTEMNRRSLHCATPDFLLSLVALAIFMRLSSATWQEIRVRPGRDDNLLRDEIARCQERFAELQIPRLRSESVTLLVFSDFGST